VQAVSSSIYRARGIPIVIIVFYFPNTKREKPPLLPYADGVYVLINWRITIAVTVIRGVNCACTCRGGGTRTHNSTPFSRSVAKRLSFLLEYVCMSIFLNVIPLCFRRPFRRRRVTCIR